MKFVVAIDGPAAAGKGTIAKAVANHFGFPHLDSGLLYRAVAAKTLKGSAPEEAAATLHAEDLNALNLRSPEIAQMASKVAAISKVRSELYDFQRNFAAKDGGAVIDGRDIGTVICPDAAVKLYVTASAEARAKRRFEELVSGDTSITLEAVFKDVKERDERDATREASPLQAASDAIIVDTTELTIEAAVNAAIKVIETALESSKHL